MNEESELCAADKSNTTDPADISSEISSIESPLSGGAGAGGGGGAGVCGVIGAAGAGTSTTFPYVVKTPRADSKLILQNMEEVLNSVKRKHKQKHRRKKEQKKKAQQEAEAAAAENAAKADESKVNQRSPKHPLQESKKNVDDIGAEIKSPLKNATILDHFARTPKKQPDEAESSPAVNGVGTAKKANAFEVMMNARNKSIGSNTPGKEVQLEETDDGQRSANAKRKMVLQEWAERKGGAKRRLEEEAKEAYIEKTMKHRAKRLKEMLTNGHADKSESKTPELAEKPEDKPSPKSIVQKKVQAARKPKRNSRQARRLSSVDSVESIDTTSQESSGFLAKLSSPIKKRDSLLGYFPKKPSPTEEGKARKDLHLELESDELTPKRPRRGIRQSKDDKVSGTPLGGEVGPVALTQSGRPKRQCSGKSKYDLDQSPVTSPTKVEAKGSTRASKKSSAKEEPQQQEVEIIDLDSESPKQTPKKLAPLFIKAVPKQTPNPEVLRAKQQFLMSGVPEKMRLEMAKQKQYEQAYEESIQVFPRLSHIRQWAAEDEAAFGTVVPTFKLRKDEDQKTPTRKMKKRAIGAFTTCTLKDFRGHPKSRSDAQTGPIPLPQIENKRYIIKDWKITYDKFPTFRCYNQLREKYRFFCAIDSDQEAEQLTESFVVTRSSGRRWQSKTKFDPDAEEEKPPPSAPNGELLFTEKYKAMSSDQVLVNMAPVNQLKEFLSSWRGAPRAVDPNASLDLNDSNSVGAASNSVVLIGPNSSGKTNAVFALANEMNFNVLEVNAGMRRTGKKLLQELQEATQSHQIRKESASKSKNLMKMTLNGLKRKKHSTDDSGSEHDLEHSARKSLILVEDADVIFEHHDAGFVDALHTLASTSKRPLILVATNPNCQHLQRLMNQNAIEFSPPNVLNISKFLSVLSLIENCPVELNDLVSLYLLNRKQLRKTILELQFYIQSGGDRPKAKKIVSSDDKTGAQCFASPTKRRFSEESMAVSESAIDDEAEKGKKRSESTEITMHKGLFEFYTVCQNTKHRIPFPVDFNLLRTNLPEIFNASRNLLATNASTRRKSKSPKKAWLSAANRPSVTRSLSDFYENLSVSTMIAGIQECEDRLTSNMSEDMAHSLLERAIEKNLAAGHYAYNLFDTPYASIILTNFTPVTPLRSSRALALDYEPSLRSICRSEKIRSTNERRGSRFYHYLRNSCVNLGSFSTEHFDTACNILFEPESIIPPQQSTQPPAN